MARLTRSVAHDDWRRPLRWSCRRRPGAERDLGASVRAMAELPSGTVTLPKPPKAPRRRARVGAGVRGLVVAEVFCVGPDAVAGHVEAIGQWLSPLRRVGGFAPVVGDPYRLTVL